MSVVGAFGDKVFEVSQNKIYTFSGLSISEKLNVEMQETEGGKPATYIKGYGEMDITLEILLLSRFCDVDNEIDYWLLKMRSKTPEYLTLGKKAYGTNKHLLVDVQVNDFVIAADGTKTKAKVSLAFKEWTKAGQKKDDNKSTSTSSGTTTTTTKKTTTTTTKTTPTYNTPNSPIVVKPKENTSKISYGNASKSPFSNLLIHTKN